MMRALPLLLALPLLAACDDPALVGRRGNVFFDQQQHADARQAYADGLARTDSLPSRLRVAFLNNTGLAHLAEGNAAAALAAFEGAVGAAPTDRLSSEAHYHAGIAAYAGEQREASLDHFRRALLARESHDDARFNWEVVRRQMQQQQQRQSGSEPPPEPSDFARELKARAERLAAERRYREAHTLMQHGLEQDETVAAFGDFINRLGTVADINELAPSQSR